MTYGAHPDVDGGRGNARKVAFRRSLDARVQQTSVMVVPGLAVCGMFWTIIVEYLALHLWRDGVMTVCNRWMRGSPDALG